ncbi:MAG: ATP-dependent zinc protease family protein [Planctomycetota bacterium]|jgi:hypothetical protein
MSTKYSVNIVTIVLFSFAACLLSGCQSAIFQEPKDPNSPPGRIEQVDDAAAFGGMYVFGEAEKVSVLPQEFTYNARLDSGATTTSIHAVDITEFSRDGKKWVRFSLLNPETEENVQTEKPLSRIASIKRHGAEDQRRPVVKLTLKMGPVEKVCEVSLTDRSKFEYPVLIGRNFLSGKAIIDVSRIYTDGIQVEED